MTRIAVCCAVLCAWSTGTIRSATAAPLEQEVERSGHEVYLTSGLTVYSSDRRVVAGLGGGPGYRYVFPFHLIVHVEGRYLSYLGSAFAANAGASYGLRLGWWEPAAGLQALVVTGDQIRVLSAASPDPPSHHAWAGQIRLEPLRVRQSAFTVSALVTDVGFGDDGGRRAFAFSLSLLDIGIQL